MGGPFLQGCLESIADGTVWPARLVVVDQSAGGDAAAWVAALGSGASDVLHVVTTPAGISAATNRGLEHVRTPYAAVTHDDCRVRVDWLSGWRPASARSATRSSPDG